ATRGPETSSRSTSFHVDVDADRRAAVTRAGRLLRDIRAFSESVEQCWDLVRDLVQTEAEAA
ncbi:unnamed protein product, partial [Amoebophrya sp. A25]